MAEGFVNLVFFFSLFLFLTSGLQYLSVLTQFPYTVALVLAGLGAQAVVHFFDLGFNFSLSPDLIYYLLLPLLLFESAIKINFHQFRLQFKTITLISTLGLLISVLAVGFGLRLVIGLPLEIALLFGAIISATDPIAVLALFKNLGAPRRLALLTEGESMFNDATAVIAFRIIAALVLGQAVKSPGLETVFSGMIQFLYVFGGSLLLGWWLGYLCSQAIAKITNQRLIEATITAGLAMSSFAIAEHWFHLSGVITTIAAGVYVGNFGKTKISGGVIKFIEDLWEYGGFFSVSLIFFFTAFNLRIDLLAQQPFVIVGVILVILIARSFSVYTSFGLSNKLSWFKEEPNVPLKWQHAINWGGLRGIIPLVLVYSLPDTFVYKQQFLTFTLAAFMFTLLVNALSIRRLLAGLGLHLTPKTEQIINEEEIIFKLEQAEKTIRSLPNDEFDPEVISELTKRLTREEAKHQRLLLKLANPRELLISLRLQALKIEKQTAEQLFLKGHLPESVYYDFEVELDLQRDALEFPEIASEIGYSTEGKLRSGKIFKDRLRIWRQWFARLPLLEFVFDIHEDTIVAERMALLKARIVAGEAVLDYLDRVSHSLMGKPRAIAALTEVEEEHKRLIAGNKKAYEELAGRYPQVAHRYQQNVIAGLIEG
jgi:CPA1 family monovalent cation:H+ antiporter